MFTPHCSPRARSFRGLDNFFVRPTVAEIRGIKLAYFHHTKPLKLTFRWPSYSPGVTSQNDYDFCMWESKVQRGAFRPRCFPATSGRGAGDPQTCQNFHLWQIAIPMQNATTRRVRSGPKISENAHFWGRMYFPTNYLRPYPQNHPKPHFGDFSMQSLLYTELSVSHTLMELRSWNFTVI